MSSRCMSLCDAAWAWRKRIDCTVTRGTYGKCGGCSAALTKVADEAMMGDWGGSGGDGDGGGTGRAAEDMAEAGGMVLGPRRGQREGGGKCGKHGGGGVEKMEVEEVAVEVGGARWREGKGGEEEGGSMEWWGGEMEVEEGVGMEVGVGMGGGGHGGGGTGEVMVEWGVEVVVGAGVKPDLVGGHKRAQG
ncbi:hypothetical protein CYMTET_21702 [Cymbomonas tetramitiformis]|uniref:Uncharacterized protein n=1 Tax=Cymbomonas tetramitiformis TaxID=36881 RepID=A0AAE0G1C4_9CHLO|nr:hypothetical protein CYMTET_21702 [Cymbomonas tetramitiformis]